MSALAEPPLPAVQQPSIADQLGRGQHGRPLLPIRLGFDPRTVFLSAMVLNVINMSNGHPQVTVLSGVLAALLTATVFTPKNWLLTWAFFALLLSCYFYLPGLWVSGLSAFIVLMGYWIPKFMIVITVGGYALLTVTPSDLSAVLQRLRVPKAIRIPAVVMLRFFPATVTELRAIRDAMTLRGIKPGLGGMLRHPARTVEYVMVPFLSSTSRLTDDLAASAMIRGLGAPLRTTSLKHFSFQVQDALLLVAVAALVGVKVAML